MKNGEKSLISNLIKDSMQTGKKVVFACLSSDK
jgi:hypothetical protein